MVTAKVVFLLSLAVFVLLFSVPSWNLAEVAKIDSVVYLAMLVVLFATTILALSTMKNEVANAG